MNTPVNLIFPCIFWKRLPPRFPPKEKISCFWEKSTIFPDNARKIMSQRNPFWKDHLFRTFEENIIFPCIFWERSSFIFRPSGKIIFSGKINIIFPDNIRKIILQRNFFEKTIFQGVWKKKIWFSVQWYMEGCLYITAKVIVNFSG